MNKGIEARIRGKIEDETYNARCVLKFTAAVFRELSTLANDTPMFNNDELNGLAVVMEGALSELCTSFDMSTVTDTENSAEAAK